VDAAAVAGVGLDRRGDGVVRAAPQPVDQYDGPLRAGRIGESPDELAASLGGSPEAIVSGSAASASPASSASDSSASSSPVSRAARRRCSVS
jgi:hypothetical protein